MSSMWLNWDATGYAESKAGLQFMRDNWDLRVFRVAMGVDAMGGYLDDPTTAKAQVNKIVQNAIDLGVYVIIDWHDQNALMHQTDAISFFDEMSKKWGGSPNVLYEVFNEPLALDWQSELKPYHQALVSTIRANDPDNVILLGTPNWDQDVDVAADSPLSGTKLMYTLHYYSCSHGASYRTKAQAAHSAKTPADLRQRMGRYQRRRRCRRPGLRERSARLAYLARSDQRQLGRVEARRLHGQQLHVQRSNLLRRWRLDER